MFPCPKMSTRANNLYMSDSHTYVICPCFWTDSVQTNKHCLCPVFQGKEVSQESVKQFYENWMSRQNTLSSQEDLADSLPLPITPPAGPSSHHAYARLKSQASKVSWGSSVSRWVLSVIRFQIWSTLHPWTIYTGMWISPLNLQLHDGWDDDLLPTAHPGGAGRAYRSAAGTRPAQRAAHENRQNWPDLWDGRISTQVGEKF